MKKIILAFDSFKGSASSEELAEAAAAGIADACPHCETVRFTLADGGEGTTAALAVAFGATPVSAATFGPLVDSITAQYAIAGNTAIIETAAASGLTLVPEGRRNPMKTSSYGTGVLIADAIRRGCRKIILGLGGSATNDAATGILAALGYRFLDSDGHELYPCGENLTKITAIDASDTDPRLARTEFVLACDVDNPFCGKHGAAAVYAPQKGAAPEQVRALDDGMRHYASILLTLTGTDILDVPGAGAAGGIAGGLLPFANARIRSGIDTVLDALGFDDALDGADLVLTGEGRIDAQSAMGKAISGIVRRATRKNVPVIALAGEVADASALIDSGLTAAFSIQTAPTDLSVAMQKDSTLRNVRRTTSQLIAALARFSR